MIFRCIHFPGNGELVPPALLFVLTIALWAFGLEDVLRYERHAVLNGEIWRLFSANFVHLGWEHLMLNLVGLVLVWYLVGRVLSVTNWLIVVVMCSVCVTGGLWMTEADLAWYVGLSGLLHGILVAGALLLVWSDPRFAFGILAIVTLKVGTEVIGEFPSPVEGIIGGQVVSMSHLYGALGGIVSWLGMCVASKVHVHFDMDSSKRQR
ncbi:rhombosortase [Marinobacter xestospongiae]